MARATLIAKLMYASPSWFGYIDAGGLLRVQAVLNRLVKQGYLPKEEPSFQVLCEKQTVHYLEQS